VLVGWCWGWLLLLVSVGGKCRRWPLGGWLGIFLPQLEIVLRCSIWSLVFGMTVLLFALIYGTWRESIPLGRRVDRGHCDRLAFTIGKY